MKNESWLEEGKRKGRNNRLLGFVIGLIVAYSTVYFYTFYL
jgi:hypothetical protein|tara:strand:- start:254 stop:376 length:123 start_codon:yes stop_codon:yes gene_type:complete